MGKSVEVLELESKCYLGLNHAKINDLIMLVVSTDIKLTSKLLQLHLAFIVI